MISTYDSRMRAFFYRLRGLHKCAWCRAPLAEGEGFNVPGFGHYCSEDHASLAQTFTM